MTGASFRTLAQMVGHMAEDFKDDTWSPPQFRLYAEQRRREVRAELEANEIKLFRVAKQVYKDPANALARINEIDQGNAPGDVRDKPGEFGTMLGLLGPSAEAQEKARELAPLLERRADLAQSVREYHDLAERAAASEASKSKDVTKLRSDRELYDNNREARKVRDKTPEMGHGDDEESVNEPRQSRSFNDFLRFIQDVNQKARDRIRSVTRSKDGGRADEDE